MAQIIDQSKEATALEQFILEAFTPHFGELKETFKKDPVWARMTELGTALWLDTGDPEDIAALWTQEFAAVTTNNTLLNKEVQKGTYDDFIPKAAEKLRELGDFDENEMRLELAFILNARHALKLVEQFDAFVSVEEHTDLAHDIENAVVYARRYYAICPERFYIKLPLSPAGVLATRTLSQEGIPVNHTLGFSARQNYFVARIAQPAFVNVFLGRLNSFVADNELGNGNHVGERAVMASQQVVQKLRNQHGIKTRQIGASLRNGEQVRDLAGLDVLTMPRKAAEPFREMNILPAELKDQTYREYVPSFREGVDPQRIGLSTLWDVPDAFMDAVEDLVQENLDAYSPEDIVGYMAERGYADLFPAWDDTQIERSKGEGKIPKFTNWEATLASGQIGLDALMNLAAMNSFVADQADMDQRVYDVQHGSKSQS